MFVNKEKKVYIIRIVNNQDPIIPTEVITSDVAAKDSLFDDISNIMSFKIDSS